MLCKWGPRGVGKGPAGEDGWCWMVGRRVRAGMLRALCGGRAGGRARACMREGVYKSLRAPQARPDVSLTAWTLVYGRVWLVCQPLPHRQGEPHRRIPGRLGSMPIGGRQVALTCPPV